jgi:hypothetical protein
MFGCTPEPYEPVSAWPFVTALKMVDLAATLKAEDAEDHDGRL